MTSKFGSEFAQVWPKYIGAAGDASALQLTPFGRNLLEKCKTVEKPKLKPVDVDIKQFMTKSSNFPVEFGTNTCRVISQPKERHEKIKEQIVSAYPIIHERVLGLYLNFLEHKNQYGNKLEHAVFGNLTLLDFVQRLLTKRCVSFFRKDDKFLLLSGEQGNSGFIEIGTNAEKLPLILQNALSYDEIKLSAFLSVSSHTEFLNDGNRYNLGVPEQNSSRIECDGVIMGIIGARLSRRDVMEFQDIIISKTQNTRANGYSLSSNEPVLTRAEDYRRLWREFYEETDLLYEEALKAKQQHNTRFGNTRHKTDIFDNLFMKKRYAISFDTLLLEAEARAAAAKKQAYIHVVGIGLGVWRVAEQQEQIFLQTFTERVKVLLPKLQHIGVLHFSWFSMTECGELKNNGIFKSETHTNGGIKTFLFNRNPADKLPNEFKNMLLFVSYAWDGNALPGNEFWLRMLKSSGDSSTACSTLVTELHNPFINVEMVNGNNLHVATQQHGVLHIADYARLMLQ